MDITVFSGQVRLGDGLSATMVFAQDFRVEQCAGRGRRLSIECEGVEILGPELHKEVSAHSVYLDHTWIGRLSGDKVEFTVLPAVEAGTHRVSIHVSAFPGAGLCDDFMLRKVVFTCE